MARRTGWRVIGALKLDENTEKTWFGTLLEADGARQRVRLSKRDVARFKGIQGERLEALKLPLFGR